MRTLGSLFAHQSAQDLQQQFANSPQFANEFETMRWYNNGFPAQFGHCGIDQKFSTDYAPLYTTPQLDFNTLAYQARGEQALTYGYYNQAVQDFGKALELNPTNPVTYLERGVAHFNLGQYDQSLSDYQHYITQKPASKEPFSISSFSLGFAKALPGGIYDSGEGALLFLADLIQHPIHTGGQVWDSLVILTKLVKTQAWASIAETLSPEICDLVVNWDLLSSYERGERAGYAFGRHGTDFLTPAIAAKGLKICQELVTLTKGLRLAEKTLLLETANAIGNSAKLEELGCASRGMTQVSQAGKVEPALELICKSDVITSPSSAYSIAENGGRHSTLIPLYSAKSAKEIEKSIKSYEKLIALHQDKIANPKKYCGGWDTFHPERKDALINRKWPAEIQCYKEQKEILEDILKQKQQ